MNCSWVKGTWPTNGPCTGWHRPRDGGGHDEGVAGRRLTGCRRPHIPPRARRRRGSRCERACAPPPQQLRRLHDAPVRMPPAHMPPALRASHLCVAGAATRPGGVRRHRALAVTPGAAPRRRPFARRPMGDGARRRTAAHNTTAGFRPSSQSARIKVRCVLVSSACPFPVH